MRPTYQQLAARVLELERPARAWNSLWNSIEALCELPEAHTPDEKLNAYIAVYEKQKARLAEREATLQRVREYRERLSQTTGDVKAREVAAVLGRILEG